MDFHLIIAVLILVVIILVLACDRNSLSLHMKLLGIVSLGAVAMLIERCFACANVKQSKSSVSGQYEDTIDFSSLDTWNQNDSQFYYEANDDSLGFSSDEFNSNQDLTQGAHEFSLDDYVGGAGKKKKEAKPAKKAEKAKKAKDTKKIKTDSKDKKSKKESAGKAVDQKTDSKLDKKEHVLPVSKKIEKADLKKYDQVSTAVIPVSKDGKKVLLAQSKSGIWLFVRAHGESKEQSALSAMKELLGVEAKTSDIKARINKEYVFQISDEMLKKHLERMEKKGKTPYYEKAGPSKRLVVSIIAAMDEKAPVVDKNKFKDAKWMTWNDAEKHMSGMDGNKASAQINTLKDAKAWVVKNMK